MSDAWGLNLCRNDETYYSLWKDVAPSYHEPKQFGVILMGNYAQWWNASGGTEVKTRLDRIAKQIAGDQGKEVHLDQLYAIVMEKFDQLENVAAKHPPENRDNFEILYKAYTIFRADFTHLVDVCETLERIARAPVPTLVAKTKQPSVYVIHENFDEWGWRTISFSMSRSSPHFSPGSCCKSVKASPVCVATNGSILRV